MLSLYIIAVSALLYLSRYLLNDIRYYIIPKGIPFIKHNTRENQLALQFADIYKSHQEHPIVGIRLLYIKACLIISDLELMKLVLVERFDCFKNRGLFYNEVDDPLSAILGTVEHGEWIDMRRKLTCAFTQEKMKMIFPQLKNVCDGLVESIIGIMDNNGEQIVEIIDKFSQCMTDTIGEVSFGNDSKELATKLREMVVKSKQPYLKFPINRFVVAFPKLARFLRIRKHRKEVTDFFVNYVSEIVKYRSENNAMKNDFMQWLIDAELGIPRIAAIAFDLLSAGYADSTSTLAYCLYELALNKEIQNRARDEVQSILEHQDFTHDVLKKMSYCHQIIKEAERKYPVAGMATRVATKDFKVPNSDTTIPRGMKIFIPIYGIHHDEKYYPDPEAFNPDRFTEEAKTQRPKYAFLPFGAGPRQCIGYRFAETLIGIGLVSLLRSFEFSRCEATEVPLQFNANKNTLHPKSGITLKMRRI